MNKAQKKMVSLILIILGAVMLLASIICFAMTGMYVSALEDAMYTSMSVSDLKMLIRAAEGASSLLGGYGEMSDLFGGYSPIPQSQLGAMKFCIGGRGWFLVLGLLFAGCGVALLMMDLDSRTVKRAKDALNKGMNSASLMVKDAVDKATVKCPACGKICTAKTAFCPACGSKMPAPAGKVVCPGCGAMHAAGRAFCTTCGSQLPKPAPAAPRTRTVCPGCGAGFDGHAAFCPECGLKLSAPEPIPLPPVEDKIPCPGCGAMHSPRAAFCTSCGMRFSEAAPAPVFEPAPEPASEPKSESEPAPIREANLFCTNCGAKLPEGAQVCPDCGAPADD